MGVVAVLFSVVFFAVSLQYTTPINVGDETGYLTKAAAIAGHKVDAASSYHAGYSIFIAPAFLLFDDPYSAWRAVLFINAAMWGISFYLLFVLLRRVFPKENPSKLGLVTTLSALYPSWLSMSGHGFSTSAFVLVLQVVLLLFVTRGQSLKRAGLLGLLTGFLYWIHPLGLVFAAATGLVLGLKLLVSRELKPYIVFVSAMALMVLFYSQVFHPFLNTQMSPSGVFWDHYSNVVGNTKADALTDLNFWKYLTIMSAGQLVALLVASFGSVAYLFLSLAEKLKIKKLNAKSLGKLLEDNQLLVGVVLLLSVAGAIVVGSISILLYWGYPNPPQTYLSAQHWIYGRYVDLFILPLLAMGFLAAWKYGRVVTTAFIILLAGIAVDRIVDLQPHQIVWQLSTISYWPIAFREQTDFMYWLFLGAIGVFAIGTLVHIFGKRMLILLVPLQIFTMFQYAGWHTASEKYYEDPSLYNVIEGAYSRGTCIGFESGSNGSERVPTLANGHLNMLAFQSFSYNMQRMSLSEWQDKCQGPFITPFVHDQKELGEAQYVAREEASGLYLIVRKEQVKQALLAAQNKSNIFAPITPGDQACITGGCFREFPREMEEYSEVGLRDGDSIVTTSQEGFLIYGPYLNLPKGNFRVSFDMDTVNASGARIRIQGYHDKAAKIYMDEPVTKSKTSYDFAVSEDANNVEVTVYVSGDTDMIIRSYSVERRDR